MSSAGDLLALFQNLKKRIDAVATQVAVVETIKGDKGDTGKEGRAGKPAPILAPAKAGDRGKVGLKGKDGLDGLQGASVTSAKLDIDGHLVFTLDDGTEIDAGEIPTGEGAPNTVNYMAGGGGGGSYTNTAEMVDALGGLEAGTTFAAVPISDLLDDLLYPYQPPQVNLTTNPSNYILEAGDTSVSNVDLTANITVGDLPIVSITFNKNLLEIHTSAADTTFTDIADITTDTNYHVVVSDGTTDVSSVKNFTFVYPFYTGVAGGGLSASGVAGLTKSISTKSSRTITNSPSTQVFYFAYPAFYGTLSSIIDPTNFDIIADYTRRTENITGLDGNAISYYIYEYNNLTSQSSFAIRYNF